MTRLAPTHQRPFSWSTIILVALVSTHVIFNQVTSALIVLALALFIGLDLILPKMPDEIKEPRRIDRLIFLTRITIVFFIIAISTIAPSGLAIVRRQADGPATNATDSMVQTEVALGYVLKGKNPYVEDYTDSALADWRAGEPPWTPVLGPLYHFVYLPFLFIGSLPFYLISHATIGWYDQRFLYILLFFLTLLLLTTLVKKQRDQLILLSLVGLNLLFILFLAEGRNDIAILFGLVLTSAFLARGQYKLSAVVLGLTLMTKHQAWFFLPFYLLYSFPHQTDRSSIQRWLKSFWPLYITVAVILIPFLIMDSHAFLEDTIGYIIGLSEYSFPIRGIGLSHLLVALGLIPSYQASYPSLLFALLAGVPILVYGLKRQWRNNSLSNLWLGFVLLGFSVQFFSRFFNDNYYIFLVQCFFIAAFIDPVDMTQKYKVR